MDTILVELKSNLQGTVVLTVDKTKIALYKRKLSAVAKENEKGEWVVWRTYLWVLYFSFLCSAHESWPI